MAVNANYASPINVNGYSCKNCTDVDYAKKHIDPARPKDGPFGINAPDKTDEVSASVLFGGRLADLADPFRSGAARAVAATGGLVNLTV